METTTLPVSAIEQGTVIDHIAAGQALTLIKLLRLDQQALQVTMGMHLPSRRMVRKDLIKVADWEISPEESARIAVFSPDATINIIKDYRTTQKYKISFPECIANVFFCPNTHCITNHEQTSRIFHIRQEGKQIQLQCHYCERRFSQQEIKHNLR